MDIQTIENICCSFAHVEQEIKWKSDLVFMVARKMFCIIDLEAVPPAVAFKVGAEVFDEISARPFCKPAPYFAQHHWVTVVDMDKIPAEEWQQFLKKSYDLVTSKFSARLRTTLGLTG